MREQNISNIYIHNKFIANYFPSIFLSGISTIFFLIYWVYLFLIYSSYSKEFFLALLISLTILIASLYLHFNKNNCISYEIIEYLGKEDEIIKYGYKIVQKDKLSVIGIKLINI